jgi:excisionase family DNA binding protein
MSEYTWVTFDELLIDLRVSRKHLRGLIKSGIVQGIGQGPYSKWRFIDPAPQVARAISIKAKLDSRRVPEIDLSEFPVISTAEFAKIAGLSQSTVRGLIHTRKIRPAKVGGIRLFTAKQVRTYLLRREKRTAAEARLPLEAIVRWFEGYYASERCESYSRAQIAADNAIETRLNRLLRQKGTGRELAIRQFWQTVATVRAASSIAHKRDH